MQLKLQTEELAYLLHAHGAQQVVGLDKQRFFPNADQDRNRLLSEGFSTLQRNGWLVQDGNAFRTNTTMMLLTSVLAAPDRVLMVERVVPGKGTQILTYAVSLGLIVEHFQAADTGHVVTQIESHNIIFERVVDAFQIKDIHPFTHSVQVNTNLPENVSISLAEDLAAALGKALAETSGDFAERFVEVEIRGRVRSIRLRRGQPELVDHMVFLWDYHRELWVLCKDEADELTLFPLTTSWAIERLSRLL